MKNILTAIILSVLFLSGGVRAAAAAENPEKQLQNPPGIPSQSDFDRIRRVHGEHANELFENVLKSGKIAPLQGGFAFMDSNAGDKTMKSEEQSKADKVAFEQALAGDWKEVLSDAGTGDWTKQWFLDGEVGTVTNSPEGIRIARSMAPPHRSSG